MRGSADSNVDYTMQIRKNASLASEFVPVCVVDTACVRPPTERENSREHEREGAPDRERERERSRNRFLSDSLIVLLTKN